MKAIAYCLIILCLCSGALAVTTAYSPTLDKVEAALDAGQILTLAAPAGLDKSKPPIDGIYEALLDPKETKALDKKALELLRKNGVQRIRVKEFAFGRWGLAWLFLLSVIGLTVGGLLVKREIRRSLAAELESSGAERKEPAELVQAIQGGLQELMSGLDGDPSTDARLHRITKELNALQKEEIEALLDARPRLQAQLGLGPFAELMGMLASLERRINRAWSAAADAVLEESLENLALARAEAQDLSHSLQEKLQRASQG